ncbi:MAG TPA: MFS transporter [Sphingomonadaceae bacterium]
MATTAEGANPYLKADGTLGSRTAWYALTLVVLMQAMSMVDRQVLSILLPRIKADLHVGDAEMGLLYGTVFALFYALFSLPLGRLSDGWVRTKLISLSLFAWSIATGLAGFARGFSLLAISRLGVGIGEASSQPAGLSLLSDAFPREKRGMIGAAMSIAVAIGLGAALTLGGSIADWWDGAYPKGTPAPLGLAGWQAAFIGSALPGLVLAALMWRLPEPKRGVADGIATPPDPAPFKASGAVLGAILPVLVWLNFVRRRASATDWAVNLIALVVIVLAAVWLTHWTDSLRAANPIAIAGLTGNAVQWSVTGFGLYVLINWFQSLKLGDRPAYATLVKSPATVIVILTASVQTMLNYAVMGFTPSYLIGHFHQSATQVGLIFGPFIAILGVVGPLIAGPVSDWAEQRFPSGRLWVTFVSLIVSPLCAVAVYTTQDLTMFYVWFTAFSLSTTMWLPPIYATLIELVLPRMRGMVTSFYILSITIIGQGIGPYAVGLMADRNGGDIASAILHLYWVAIPILVLAGLSIWRYRIDKPLVLERARAAGEPV